jgi:hypothetical protein
MAMMNFIRAPFGYAGSSGFGQGSKERAIFLKRLCHTGFRHILRTCTKRRAYFLIFWLHFEQAATFISVSSAQIVIF